MSQYIKYILVGTDSESDGQLFYVTHIRSILGSSDYKLDPIHPSGPMFLKASNLIYMFLIVIICDH